MLELAESLIRDQILDNKTADEALNEIEDTRRCYERLANPGTPQQWARNLTRMFNNFDGKDDNEKKAQAVLMEHRTLQQNFMRFVLSFIKAEAENENTDPRNQATHEVCTKLQEILEKEHTALPFI
jgi:hypothetical protein